MDEVENSDEQPMGDDLVESLNLSPLQQGMLFHTLRDKGVGMYISQAVSRYENLDVEALKNAWQTAIDRHSILRTSFHWDDPENPKQHIHIKLVVPFESLDWRGLSPSEQHAKLRHYQRELRDKGFELNQAPLLKVVVIRVSHTRWFCINTHHHIILDGWSGGLLATEIGRLYESGRRGRKINLPFSRSFSDYIRWIDKQDLTKAEQFWRRHLSGVQGPTPLPAELDTEASSRVRMHVDSWPTVFNETTIKGLEQLARKCRVTVNTVILAAWAMMLSRYSGQPSVLFGLLVSGRPPSLEGVESIVGMFLNTLPFRVKVDPEALLENWLQEIHLEQLELQSFEYSPLMMVQKWSDIPAGIPLFRSIVARKDITQSGTVSGEASSRAPQGGRSEQSVFQQNYPMLLNITASNGLQLKITYDARLFDTADMAWMMEQLNHLMVELAKDHTRKIGHYSLLSVNECKRVLVDWNQTQVDFPESLCLHHLFEKAALETPHTNALQYRDERMSYEALNMRANRLAHHWIAQGIGPGSVILLFLDRSDFFATALLAAFKANACCLAVDPSMPHEYVKDMLAGQHLSRAITIQSLSDRLPLIGLKIDFIDDDESKWIHHSTSNPALDALASRVCFIATKIRGSKPVGIEFTHQSLVTRVVNLNAPLNTAGSLGARSPVYSADLIWELFYSWSKNAMAHLLPRESTDFAADLLHEIEQSGVTEILITPTLLDACMKLENASVRASSVTQWFCTGEVLTPEVCVRFASCFPKATLRNLYSTAETGACLVWEVTAQELEKGVRLGRPLPNVRAYILDPQRNPCPVGIAGQLFIGGAVLATGLQRRPDLHADPFEKDPFCGVENQRMFATGDLARRWADGNIEYLCRMDEQEVDDRYGRIDLLGIQRALQRHPQVRQASVIIRDGILVAFIVGTDSKPDIANLNRNLAGLFPAHSLPSEYVMLNSLPLTAEGRIDRLALLEDKSAAINTSIIEKKMQSPRSELEETISSVWKSVLRIDTLSIDDNFFMLGGHSLNATKATARLTKILQSDIPLKAIFEAPTISSLAEWIQRDNHREELPFSIQAADRGREAPLTFTQQQLWVLGQLHPNLPTYTIPSNTIFNGHMNIEALRLALRDLVKRHEILRTTFILRNGEPIQVINPAPEYIDIQMIDVSHLPESERMTRARWHGAQIGKRPWNFELGPLIRPQLVKISDTKYVLNTMFHHIISDGPSMGVFCAELGKIYDSHALGRALRLPELSLQFADYAIWERENIKGDLFRRQLQYWKAKLAGAALLQIPTDFARPAVHGFFGKKIKFDIDRDIIQRLRALGQEESATMFMCLLSVYQLLLFRYSGQEDVLIGTAMTNRIRVELERLIGLFVNTLPIRTDFSGDPTFREVLRRARDSCREAFANMDLPFEETIAQINPHRDLSRQGSPIFQFMLIHNPAGHGKSDSENAAGFRPGDPHNDTGHANFDALLSTRETLDGEVKITMSYDTELFRPETIDRMIGHLQRLFSQVTDYPDKPLSQLVMADEEEQKDVLVHWNGIPLPVEKRCVQEFIREHAVEKPEHPALVFEEQIVSYGQLEERSSQLARQLHVCGVGPECMVGICLNRGISLIVGLLGILKAGGAFVPIDPTYPIERIRYILRDTNCPVLVSDANFDRSILTAEVNPVILDINAGEISKQSGEPVHSGVCGHNLAYVIYTSGSTGLPKGVMVEHRNLSSIVRSQIKAFEISRNSRVLQMMSLSFDAAVGEVFRTLVAGGTLYLAHKDDVLPGPSLVDLLLRRRITAIALSSTALAAIPYVQDSLPDLQTVTVGGEACPPHVAQRWGIGRRLINGYGPTETTIGATFASNWDLNGKPPLGRPLDGVQVYVLDKTMQLSPVGIPGELYISGVGVTRGYHNNPELTKERFLPNPFSKDPGARMYRTGDLARWLSSGNLDFLGRIDHQVKIRGFRIELGEIESALLDHPGVSQCIVTVNEAKDVKRLAAYLVCEGEEAPETVDLRSFLKDRLPEYMIPAWFIVLPALPMNSSGKIDRSALPEPDMGSLNSKADYVAPSSEVEKKLAELWSMVLGIPRVGLNDNFFELGGDSISTIRVVARATEAGLTLTPRDIFQFQTLAELAEHVTSSEKGFVTA